MKVMHARRYFILTIILTAIYCTAAAQSTLYTVKHYTAADGLPSSIVRDVAWDSSGFMWISTMRGMVRFDGVWMKLFTNKTDPHIKDEYSSPITVTRDGKNIYCDALGNIYTLENYNPVLLDTTYAKKIEINHLAFSLPAQFRNDIAHSKKNIYHIFNEPVVTDSTHFLVTDNHDLILYSLSAHEYTLIKTFAHDIKIFTTGGNIYLYEKGGLLSAIKLSGDYKTLVQRPLQASATLHNAIDIYWRNGMEQPVVIIDRHAYLLSIKNGIPHKELICDDLPNDIFITNIKYNAITQMTVVVTDGNGIYIYKRKPLTSYVFKTSAVFSAAHSFYSQVEISPGYIWLTDDLNLDINKKKFSARNSNYTFNIASRLKDSLALFCSTAFNTTWSYAFNTKKITRRVNIANSNSAAFAMTQNRLFCAANSNIVEMSAAGDTVFYKLPNHKDYNEDIAKDMIEYKPGYLIVCGANGVFGFDIHTKDIDTLLAADHKSMPRSLKVFKDYLLVCDYGRGIWAIKNNVAKLLPLDKKKYLLYAQNIFIDSNNYAWIAANAGIMRLKIANLVKRFYTAHNDSGYINCEYYGKDYGMDISELNGGWQGSMIQLKNGMLSYVGINGVVVADINRFNTIRGYRSKIIIDKITINDTVTDNAKFLKNPVLKQDARSLKFYFNIPDWKDPQNSGLQYLVTGLSEKWQDINYVTQNFVELKNMPPGNYTLHLRAFSLANDQDYAEVTLPFEIETPWYKTLFFYFIAASVLMIGTAYIFRWRVNFLKERNKALAQKVAEQVQSITLQKGKLEEQINEMEDYQQKLEKDYALKNRLISIIGHDIITPLRFMNRAGKVLLTRRDTIDQASFDDTLQTILETGNSLQDMAANMLNWIKHHQETMRFMLSDFDIGEQVKAVIQNIQPLADFKQLVIQNPVPPGISAHQYCDPFKTILVQLLTNSVKYSENGTIFLDINVVNKIVCIAVTDQGIGMPDEVIAHLMDSDKLTTFTSVHENNGHGFGFLIIKDMLKIIHGKIKIESMLGQGSRIIINFPLEITEKEA